LWTCEPEQDNHATRLSFEIAYFLRRDPGHRMRNDLSSGVHRVTGMANPKPDQDGVQLRTLKNSEMEVLRQANTTVDTAVNDAIRNPRKAVENTVAEAIGSYRAGRSRDDSWNNHKITNLANAANDSDAINKNFLV